jgi:urocanate hydratase
VIAEVDGAALQKRHTQGWVDEIATDLGDCLSRIRRARASATSVSIAYHGNVVDLWEALAAVGDELLVDLGSDQTSLHNPFGGGYYPVGMSMEAAQ